MNKAITKKTPVKKNSITKEATKDFFKFTLTLFQFIKIHKGVNNVVKKMRDNEIPSIARLQLECEVLINEYSQKNWE